MRVMCLCPFIKPTSTYWFEILCTRVSSFSYLRSRVLAIVGYLYTNWFNVNHFDFTLVICLVLNLDTSHYSIIWYLRRVVFSTALL